MMVFPLSTGGRIVLMLVAIVLGCILWMLVKPAHWTWLLRKKEPKEPKIEEKK